MSSKLDALTRFSAPLLLRPLARDDRGMGQDRHDSMDGEAFGSQSVTFSDRL